MASFGVSPRWKVGLCNRHKRRQWVRPVSCSSPGKNSPPAYRALLVDVGGTLLETSQPVPQVYASFGSKYGIQADADAIKKGFKKAFSEPWPERLRYEGDGRRFWKYAVATATGCDNDDYFEELYQYFGRGDAWKLVDGAERALKDLRGAGGKLILFSLGRSCDFSRAFWPPVQLAVVSNFDSRLRPILAELNISDVFDALVISSEIGHEKPAKEIFLTALDELGVQARDTVHVGDDPVADKQGANAVGIDAWLWKKEVKSFEEIKDRILVPTSFPK
ncbi:haloacid dehalogenase-like hydrolase domain-containing protein 3 isoform X2 [Selaginella moellendorffii]|nr:haloacid dehalogenase-like hydrolase domain-containing protein 3 isoform X2 [Selaginella moellendorffii]|eukprot:XP_024529737.1 haloacid dehalogenase-like hydrolase domain-containing protein 3 isoform X2 [Selaginella moellendorffii]